MIDPDRLAAFMAMTAATSVVPGLSMLLVMSQTLRAGWRAGAEALAGLQLGYLVWWVLAALGLGTLAAAFPIAFRILAIGGALYLGWIGVEVLRHAGQAANPGERGRLTTNPLRDGVLVALGNPKALVYIVALLPPFVNARQPVVPQLVVFALVAMVIDVALGVAYIFAGNRLAVVMTRHETRRRIDIGIGAVFILLALGILVELLRH